MCFRKRNPEKEFRSEMSVVSRRPRFSVASKQATSGDPSLMFISHIPQRIGNHDLCMLQFQRLLGMRHKEFIHTLDHNKLPSFQQAIDPSFYEFF